MELISKTLERCRSLGKAHQRSSTTKKHKVSPEGYFSVYVGPEKKRFVVKTSCMSHPFFRVLLDEAEREYEFTNKGPLELPCGVDLFCRVLCDMEKEIGPEAATWSCSAAASPMRIFNRGNGAGYQMLSPSRLVMLGRAKSG